MIRTVSALIGLSLCLPAAALAQPPAAPGAYPAGGAYPGGGAYAAPGGGMTLQQFQARQRAKLMRLDANHDGRISMAEYAAKPGHDGRPRDPQKAFAKFDTNHDGFLEANEIDAMTARKFQKLDLNHDGVVTREEHASRRQGMGPMGPGQQPPMPQPR